MAAAVFLAKHAGEQPALGNIATYTVLAAIKNRPKFLTWPKLQILSAKFPQTPEDIVE